jgi:hypothetical protein
MIRSNLWMAASGPAAALLIGAPALADDDPLPRIEVPSGISFASQPPQPDAALKEGPAPPPSPRQYGKDGSKWWTVGAGVAYNFNDATDINLPRVAFSLFLAEDVEWSVELNAWHFSQRGDDATGFNPAMVFRWHFVDTGAWTTYADVGIGVLWADKEVPDGGSKFDFTPRAGVGITRRLGESNARLQLGLRWHHISNARIYGESRNPSRDAPMIYGAIVFPF